MDIPTVVKVVKTGHEAISNMHEFREAWDAVRLRHYRHFLAGFAPGDFEAEVRLIEHLKDPKKQKWTFKFVEEALRSGNAIAMIALGRIYSALVQTSPHYNSYEASKALRSIRDLDDVEARVFILGIVALKHTEARVRTGMGTQSISEAIIADITLQKLQKANFDKDCLPESIQTDEDLAEILSRLVGLGLFRSAQGHMDTTEFSVAITDFTKKICQDLIWAADKAGYTVMEISND